MIMLLQLGLYLVVGFLFGLGFHVSGRLINRK